MDFGLYQHYKGKFYQVLDLAKHSETQEEMVVYQALHGDFDVWVRPKTMFEENVKVENGNMVPRFTLVYEDDDEDVEDDELLTLFDNELEMRKAVKKLEDSDVEFNVIEERLEPKPAHLRSDVLYKFFVTEDDFERAMELLKDI